MGNRVGRSAPCAGDCARPALQFCNAEVADLWTAQRIPVILSDITLAGEIQPPAVSLRTLTAADLLRREPVEVVGGAMPGGCVLDVFVGRRLRLLHEILLPAPLDIEQPLVGGLLRPRRAHRRIGTDIESVLLRDRRHTLHEGLFALRRLLHGRSFRTDTFDRLIFCPGFAF